jgi:hypothetical protein
MHKQENRLHEIVFLFFISVLYLGLTLYDLRLPAPLGDETREANIAVQILNHERPLVLIFLPYFGPTQIYLLIPAFSIFGVNVYSLRLVPILFGLIALIFFYLFSRQLFNQKIAMLSSFLLTLSPTFIFFNRQGIYANSIILLPIFASLYFFILGFHNKKAWPFYIGSFIFGIGITTKLTFWWIIPSTIFLFYANRKNFSLRWQEAAFCIFSGIIGSLPIILYNIQTGFGTFTYLFLSRITKYNPSILSIIATRVLNLYDTLSGSLGSLHFGLSLHNILMPILFLISLLLIPFKKKTWNLFVLFFICTVFLESFISPSTMNSVHLFMLIPFGFLAISVIFYDALEHIKIIAILVLSLAVLFNVSNIIEYHAYLIKIGGQGRSSDAVYDLASYLEKNKILTPIFTDHSLYEVLHIVSGGRIEMKDTYKLTNCSHPVYYVADFQEIWITNASFSLEKTFYDRNSQPVYLLYSLCSDAEHSIPNPSDSRSKVQIHPCPDCSVRFGYANNQTIRFNYFIPHNKNNRSIFLHKIIERLFSMDVNYGWVWLCNDFVYLNFSKYSSINLYILSDNQTSGLQFKVTDADKNEWYFFDNQSLSQENWTIIQMPFKDFVRPPWVNIGSKKRNFADIRQICITLTSFDKPINKTVYFKTFGEEIFYLE